MFSFIFIAGLFIGRGLYCAALAFEGRKKIYFLRCPSCKHFIGWIPVLSWIFSHHCSYCERLKDIRQPILEILTAVGLTCIYLTHSNSWMALEIGIFCLLALTASTVDLKRTILPDTCTMGGLLLALAGAYLNPEREWMDAFLGMSIGGGLFLIMSLGYYLLRRHEGLGWGDIKMMAWVGALVGPQGILKVIFLSSVLGLIYGVYVLFKRGSGWMTGIPFGPYIALATYILLVFFKDSINSCLVYLCII